MAGGSETTRRQRVAGEVDAARASTARTVKSHADRRRPGSVAVSTTDLRQAMVLNELRLVYQPQVDVGSGRLTGVEALLRWDHPRHGTLLPAQFVDAIATYGMWARVTGWVLQQAIADAATWQRSGAPTRVWVKNTGASTVEPVTRVDVFFGPQDNFQRIAYGTDSSCTAPCWYYSIENSSTWEPTATLHITVKTSANLSSSTTYYIKVVTPNGISDSKFFTV